MGKENPNGYEGPERRRAISEADIERIAEVAAQKALDKVYLEVGKGVLRRLAWVIGVSTVALLMWMGGKGIHLS